MANTLVNSPTDYSLYEKWTKTNMQNPGVVNFSLTEIWTLMRSAVDTTLQSRADDIQNAFNYIVSHPDPYKTAVTLDVQSDWAEFGILTPSAVIVADPSKPYPSNTTASDNKVTFGKEYSHVIKREILKFVVTSIFTSRYAADDCILSASSSSTTGLPSTSTSHMEVRGVRGGTAGPRLRWRTYVSTLFYRFTEI